MAWPVPLYSRNQVNTAGEILVSDIGDDEAWTWASNVLSNWRACHGYPINTFQSTLRTKLKLIDPEAIVAQRLKRSVSIVKKLARFEGMKLARMQDIGGLRAVVQNPGKMRVLERNYRDSRFTHQLVNEHDYVTRPKESGYRSIHLIYRYRGGTVRDYDGLSVEMQIRTKQQHAWASAVETVGTFLDHSLKSSEGPKAWLRFFAMTSSAFAHIERSPLVPGFETMSAGETFEAVTAMAHELGVHDKLQGFTIAVDQISQKVHHGAYYLVILDVPTQSVKVETFSRTQLGEASDRYAEVERLIDDGTYTQAVLVSAGSVESLRRAYPSYFLDTRSFLDRLHRLEKRGPTNFRYVPV